VPSLAIPNADAVLVYGEELAKGGLARAFLWYARRGNQQRAVRIFLDDQAAWTLTPQPADDAEVRRAAAQLALSTVRAGLEAAAFFADQSEFNVQVDTFHPNVNEHGQLVWDPGATPYQPDPPNQADLSQ
jgi:hypothetical protein